MANAFRDIVWHDWHAYDIDVYGIGHTKQRTKERKKQRRRARRVLKQELRRGLDY